MTDRRRFPLWPWIAALLAALPALYVLSVGLLMALASRGMMSPAIRAAAAIYVTPYEWAYVHGPPWLCAAMDAYRNFWWS